MKDINLNLTQAELEKLRHIWEKDVDNYMIVDVYDGEEKDYVMIIDLAKNGEVRFSNPVHSLVVFRNLVEVGGRVIKVDQKRVRQSIQERNVNFLQELAEEYDKKQRGEE